MKNLNFLDYIGRWLNDNLKLLSNYLKIIIRDKTIMSLTQWNNLT